jgi:putative nucleotidyltransferase with HDIG domain
MDTTPPTETDVTGTLLFVDDEQNILSSLKRLFRPLGYTIHTANGGAEGLSVLEKEAVDIVVSDMRMPEMDGAQFLEQVAARWPNTVRILLTGYADIGSTVAAINKGGIWKYVSKPWDDNDLKQSVHIALERKRLVDENRRLEQLTQKQNEELRELNSGLEAKVAARTGEIQQMMDQLDLTHETLKKSYTQSVKVFASLIEMREQMGRGHARRVADVAQRIAARLGLSEAEMQDVMYAALLHDIGKMGLPDKVLAKPFQELSPTERMDVVKHPAIGQGVLMALEPLQEAARFIRAHHEQFDGKGFPDGLAGDKIPLGARILAVANDYDALQTGTLIARRVTPKEALDFIVKQRGKRYDPKVVDALAAGTSAEPLTEAPRAQGFKTASKDLRPGMTLTADLAMKDGVLLLSRGYLLDEQLIAKIQNLEQSLGCAFDIFTLPPKPALKK